MFQGKATPEATRAFLQKHGVHPNQQRRFGDVMVSSLALGTYLGRMDEVTDLNVTQACIQAWDQGCNFVDTAINYRGQRAERSVGEALRRAILSKKIAREEIFVSTKAGFIPFEGTPVKDMKALFEEQYVSRGIARASDVVAGCHCIEPAYLVDQVHRSRQNLGLSTIDLYYIHNPETQLEEMPERIFYQKLEEAFFTMETLVSEEKIGAYGMATWDGFRAESSAQGHLNLEKCVQAAEKAAARKGHAKHSFAAVQLPFNLAMPEALLVNTQTFNGHPHAPITTAKDLGLSVSVSVPLYQARLCHGLPDFLVDSFPKDLSQAQCALAFATSFPEIDAAMVGMKQFDHVKHNLEYLKMPRLSVDQLHMVIGSMVER